MLYNNINNVNITSKLFNTGIFLKRVILFMKWLIAFYHLFLKCFLLL